MKRNYFFCFTPDNKKTKELRANLNGEYLIFTLFKVQNFISEQRIQILQTIGKNFPEIFCK